ncbi:hypothetical protein ATG66_0857 [Vibrio sp. ES.051]|uniref:hypothetical protein n=1 Tax=Vibrio sp. ES.051 TaxID=1761909 RepID=UPI000BF95896|nr:hypothetical protein [Vibrio sp. ES.051]PFG58315.1 hypothetical protein ATG66_0857 [Vibrio sp. ES.051]
MRLKPLHTIWLTLCTTLILLVSSVVNSAPLMSLKMMSGNNIMSKQITSMTSGSEHCGSPSIKVEVPVSSESHSAEMSMACSDGSGIAHNCCTASCSFVFVPLPAPVNQLSPMAHRASVLPEIMTPIVQISLDLYRPPIV